MHDQLEELARRASQECLGAGVRQLARRITQTFDLHLGEVGLTLSQFNVMTAIVLMREEASAAHLSKSLHADRSTLSREIGILVSRGIVQPDQARGRTRPLALSEIGRALYQQAWEAWETACRDIDRLYGADRAKELLSLIHRLLD